VSRVGCQRLLAIVCGAPAAEIDLNRDRRQGAQKRNGSLEDACPRPLERGAQRRAPSAADEAARNRHNAGPHCAGNYELTLACDLTEDRRPSD
jgi:hypothetical protein